MNYRKTKLAIAIAVACNLPVAMAEHSKQDGNSHLSLKNSWNNSALKDERRTEKRSDKSDGNHGRDKAKSKKHGDKNKQPTIDICHWDGGNGQILLTIPGKAANKHIARHGDSMPMFRFRDADGDGYGDPEAFVETCDELDGFVEDDTDLDDTDSTITDIEPTMAPPAPAPTMAPSAPPSAPAPAPTMAPAGPPSAPGYAPTMAPPGPPSAPAPAPTMAPAGPPSAPPAGPPPAGPPA